MALVPRDSGMERIEELFMSSMGLWHGEDRGAFYEFLEVGSMGLWHGG
jgi:hypothetical protein